MSHWIEKIPKECKRFQKIPNNYKKFHKNPKESRRIQKIPNRRFQKILKDSKKFQKIQKDSIALKMVKAFKYLLTIQWSMYSKKLMSPALPLRSLLTQRIRVAQAWLAGAHKKWKGLQQ